MMVDPPIVSVAATFIASICHRLYRAAEIWGALYICVSCGDRTVAERVTLCVAEPRPTTLEPASPSKNYRDGETTRTTVLAVHMARCQKSIGRSRLSS